LDMRKRRALLYSNGHVIFWIRDIHTENKRNLSGLNSYALPVFFKFVEHPLHNGTSYGATSSVSATKSVVQNQKFTRGCKAYVMNNGPFFNGLNSVHAILCNKESVLICFFPLLYDTIFTFTYDHP